MNIFDTEYFDYVMEESAHEKLNRVKKTFDDAGNRFADAVTSEAQNRDNMYKVRNATPVILYRADLINMPYPHRDQSWRYLINFMFKNQLTITYKKSFITNNATKDLRTYDFIGIMNDKTNKEVRHPNYEKAKRFMSFVKSNRQKLSKATSYKEFVGIISTFRI
jgi:hypothetical protein